MPSNITTTHRYTGQGILKAANVLGDGSTDGFVDVGRVNGLGIIIKSTEVLHKSSRGGSGETDFQMNIIKGVSIEANLFSLHSENLAWLLGGSLLEYGSGTLTVTRKANKGKTLYTGYMRLSDVSVTSIGGGSTYQVNTDYTLNETLGTITVIDGGAIADGENVSVMLTHDGHSSVVVNEPSRGLRSLVFEGCNTVSGEPVIVEIFCVAARLLQEFLVIRNEAGYHTFKGSLLSAGGDGESGYFKIRLGV